MDMVLNHAYGSNPLVRMYYDKSTYKVTAENPWFNVNSPNTAYSWGYDFNHTSDATKSFVDSVCHYWLNEFKIDGFRYDFTKGFTNTAGDGWAYDASRIAIIKRMGDKIWSYKPDAHLLLEHFAANTEEKVLAGYGFMLWGNAKGQYQEASMGYTSDLSGASYLDLEWTSPGLVDYMESHDEERIMYKNLNYGNASGSYMIKNFPTAIDRAKLCALFFFTIPGPKMIWQFEEVGYDITNGDYGRVGEMPIKWDYYSDPNRRNLFDNFRALIDLKKKYEVFSSVNYALYQNGNIKRLNIEQAEMDVAVFGNFGVVDGYVPGNFSRTGKWYEFFSGDSVTITETNLHLRIDLNPGEYKLYTSNRISRPSYIVGIEDTYIPGELAEMDFNISPNPFTDEVLVTFINEEGHQPQIIEIFALDGSAVFSMKLPAGISEYRWDGRNSGGLEVNPGIYLLSLTSGNRQSVKKVIKF